MRTLRVRRVESCAWSPNSSFATQLVGLSIMRYVVKVEPLAGAGREQLERALVPVVRHYLEDDWVMPA